MDDEKRPSNSSLQNDASTYFETNSGKVIKAISSKSIAEIENELASMGPYDEILMENGGRSATMLVLQALDLAKKKTEQCKKNITILCGNNKAGAYGFATARHLLNHGCNVTVATPYQDLEKDVKLFTNQLVCKYSTNPLFTLWWSCEINPWYKLYYNRNPQS